MCLFRMYFTRVSFNLNPSFLIFWFLLPPHLYTNHTLKRYRRRLYRLKDFIYGNEKPRKKFNISQDFFTQEIKTDVCKLSV